MRFAEGVCVYRESLKREYRLRACKENESGRIFSSLSSWRVSKASVAIQGIKHVLPIVTAMGGHCNFTLGAFLGFHLLVVRHALSLAK